MSIVGDQFLILSRIAIVFLSGLWFASCTSDKKIRAPVRTVISSDSLDRRRILNCPVSIRSDFSSSINRRDTNVFAKNGCIIYNRNYENIPKRSYCGDTYIVKWGDTLFYIAWITGNDFRELAKRNNITVPYKLKVGETLQVSNESSLNIANNNFITLPNMPQSVLPNSSSSKEIRTIPIVPKQPITRHPVDAIEKSMNGKICPSKEKVTTFETKNSSVTEVPKANSIISNHTHVTRWCWPTEGKIIDGFSSVRGGNKGIDISGTRGQAVVSAAFGRVVYTGNALRGYGNLIIIKHNDDYLSAYAHNEKILIREQEEVKMGQRIASMGSSGVNSVKLHFEIRYKGKSVNPLHYLPKR